ncbi:MAG: hypothetical protein IE880_05065 [Epsilonproteobacteria bacterium]|nr:hypothetical protein [Campylobacterota bacterium]
MNRPPEDCGGIHGFEDFKEIMGNRKHPEFKEMKTWYGGMYCQGWSKNRHPLKYMKCLF